MDSKICVTVKHNMTIRRCASVDVLNFADQRLQILSCMRKYDNYITTMEVKSVGTFPVILLKLATPPLPPQTKLNLEQNG